MEISRSYWIQMLDRVARPRFKVYVFPNDVRISFERMRGADTRERALVFLRLIQPYLDRTSTFDLEAKAPLPARLERDGALFTTFTTVELDGMRVFLYQKNGNYRLSAFAFEAQPRDPRGAPRRSPTEIPEY